VGGTLYWLHTDRLGSINATTDDTGVQVLRRSFRSYGELLGQTGTHAESLGYIGQRTDAETANGTTDDKGLTYLHARYYDSALGIFLSPDPIGADVNTYRYSFGDSVNISDPSGLVGTREHDPEQKDKNQEECEKHYAPKSAAALQCAAALAAAGSGANETLTVTGKAPEEKLLTRLADRIEGFVRDAVSRGRRAVAVVREELTPRTDCQARSEALDAAAVGAGGGTALATRYRPSPDVAFGGHMRSLARNAFGSGLGGLLVEGVADELPRGSGGRVVLYAVATGLNLASTAEAASLTSGLAVATFGTSPVITPVPGATATALAGAVTALSAAQTGDTLSKTIDALTDAAAGCVVPGGGAQ